MTLQTILTPWQFWGTVAIFVILAACAIGLLVWQNKEYKRLINMRKGD
jgi:hypothetical protein